MAAFWIAALALLYVAMDRYLQPPALTVTAEGVLLLKRHRDGHFYADGQVNEQSVRFLVDTGATSVALTDELASRAGLHGGEMAQFHTANGVRMGRIVRADSVKIGPLQVNNISVSTGYTGKNVQDALLGQNFLRQFWVSINGDELEMRRR
ncbi:hypothetical protein OX89_09360 [Diaphorobacter sp. J5-51]|nr:hypothetical protein OX89_09360 [Diaphorobacter sp. J5-51]